MKWGTDLEALDKEIEEKKAKGVYGVIYMARCKVTGKVYIGQTTRKLSERFYQHLNNNSCTHFHNAIKKHGTENFEIIILDYCKSKEHLDEREKYWIAYYGFGTPHDMTYNLKGGGEGGEHSEITKQRLSEAWDDRKVAVDVYEIVGKGKPCVKLFTSESIADAERRLKEDYEAEISAASISNILQGLRPSYKGFTFTKEGSPVPTYNPEEKAHKVARLKKDTMEVLEIYESVKQAARWLVEHGYANTKFIRGIVSNILNCCRGHQKYKTRFKFVWRFVDDDGNLIPPEEAPQPQFSTKATPIQALDINTREVVKTFESKSEAMRWLVDEGKAENTHPSLLIQAIKYNKSAYGYFWREVQE